MTLISLKLMIYPLKSNINFSLNLKNGLLDLEFKSIIANQLKPCQKLSPSISSDASGPLNIIEFKALI